MCFTLQRTTPLYIKGTSLFCESACWPSLTHSLTHSSVAPVLLFLPPQSDVADIYASSVKAHHTHCICICLCIWCISLKPPCRPIRCASRGEICHNQYDQSVVSKFYQTFTKLTKLFSFFLGDPVYHTQSKYIID